jgi:transposase
VKDCGSKKTLFALEQGRADIARRRRRWRAWQARLDSRRLVFIDETWIKTSMAPLRGWGPKGERLRAFAPHGRWRTMTFLGALRCDQLTAPCVFDGPINGECFRANVEQQLIPVLRAGDIVVMDNLGSHKSAALRRMIRIAGAKLCICRPTHPISIRSSRPSPRSSTGCASPRSARPKMVWRHIGTLVPAIEPAECANYFTNAGYASVKI